MCDSTTINFSIFLARKLVCVHIFLYYKLCFYEHSLEYLKMELESKWKLKFFSFARWCQVLFQRSCNLFSHQHCIGVPLDPLTIQQFLVYNQYTRCKWYLTVILICISLIIYEIEHLFICLVVKHGSSVKYLFGHFVNFSIRWFFMLVFSSLFWILYLCYLCV